MSLDFWVKLFFALILFVLGLLFINRSKFEFVRKLQAKYLRNRLIPKLKEILPLISTQLQSAEPNLFPLFRLKADIEVLSAKSHSLFAEERTAIANFLANLSTEIANFEAGVSTTKDLEELVLSGQRTVNELVELGK